MSEEINGKRQALGHFTLTLNLTDRRGIQVQAVQYSDDTPEELNKRLDALQDVLDRQAVRFDIIDKQARIRSFETGLEAMKETMEGMSAKQKKGMKLTSSEKEHVGNYSRQVDHAKKQIASLEADIAEARKKYGIA